MSSSEDRSAADLVPLGKMTDSALDACSPTRFMAELDDDLRNHGGMLSDELRSAIARRIGVTAEPPMMEPIIVRDGEW